MFHLSEVMTEWGAGKDERKEGWGKKPKTKQSPFPYSLPQVFQLPDLGVDKGVCWLREGDVKATDFLTSLAALAPGLQPRHLGSQDWREAGEGLGGLEEGALPLPLIKFRLPLPLSWLRERPGDSKNERE